MISGGVGDNDMTVRYCTVFANESQGERFWNLMRICREEDRR